MERKCKNCRHFTAGVTDRQRKEWSYSNWGTYADGVCNLDFPRGYVGRKAPHAAHSTGSCFQYQPPEAEEKGAI